MLAAVSTLPRAGLVMSPSRPPPAVQVEFEFWFCPKPAEPPKLLLVSPPFIVHVDDDAGAAAAAARDGPPNPFPRLSPPAAGRAAPAEDPSSSLLRIIFGTSPPAPPPDANESPPPYSRAMLAMLPGFFVGSLPSASSWPAVVHFPVGISVPFSPLVVMCRFCGGGGVAFPLSLLLLPLQLVLLLF